MDKTEKAKLMDSWQIDAQEQEMRLALDEGVISPFVMEVQKKVCAQARLANAQAERLERLEEVVKAAKYIDKVGHTYSDDCRGDKCGGQRLHLALSALSPSTTKGEG